jgi:hypothetical protein
VVTTYPNGTPQPLDPVFVVIFDQRIDPLSVLKTVTVNAGGANVNLVLADQADLEKDAGAGQLTKDAPEGRWLAFRAVDAFMPNTSITVSIGPGTPSD